MHSSISENVKGKLEQQLQKKAQPHIGTARTKLQGVTITTSVYNVRQSQFQSKYFSGGNQYNVELFLISVLYYGWPHHPFSGTMQSGFTLSHLCIVQYLGETKGDD